jgi:hypothetical protein
VSHPIDIRARRDARFLAAIFLIALGIAALICMAGLLCVGPPRAPMSAKLLGLEPNPLGGGSGARAYFQFENPRNQPVEVRTCFLERQEGGKWRVSQEPAYAEFLGMPRSPLPMWPVPARVTNVFFCQAPTLQTAYRMNLECYPFGTNPSYVGSRLRHILAGLVWRSCRPNGPNVRLVPLSKSKLMCRIEGGAWLVTETFQARPWKKANGSVAGFLPPANGVNVPDRRDLPSR